MASKTVGCLFWLGQPRGLPWLATWFAHEIGEAKPLASHGQQERWPFVLAGTVNRFSIIGRYFVQLH